MNKWKISEAKAKFTQLIVSSNQSPQIICNREKPISVVMDIRLFEELMALKQKQDKPTIAELLAKLHLINESERVDLEIPSRKDRPQALEEISDEMAL
jgi:prevent-host-death family protein